jgi:protoporphyrinogen/coproporphyrinogen III oxidase
VLLRVFVGGALADHLAVAPEHDLVAIAQRELAELLGVRGSPSLVRVVRHLHAMPQYELGHLGRVDAIERAVGRLDGPALAGSAYRGVGIPDCVHSGEHAVDVLLERVLQR